MILFVVAAIFVVWHRSEGTLSIHSITTHRRELYYWAAVLATFEHLESIPDDPRRWPASIRSRDTLARTLATQRQDAMLYRTLATLRTDAPIDTDLSSLEHRGVPREPFLLFCEQVGASSLPPRVERWAA